MDQVVDTFCDTFNRYELTNFKIKDFNKPVFILGSPFALEQMNFITEASNADIKKCKFNFAYAGGQNTIHYINECKDIKKLRGKINYSLAGFNTIFKHNVTKSLDDGEFISFDYFFVINKNEIVYINTDRSKEYLKSMGDFKLIVRMLACIDHYSRYMWTAQLKGINFNYAFLIEPSKAKFMFNHREKDQETNTKKRIIHFLKEHERWVNSKKDTTLVKNHFRGKQDLKYFGYDISIIPSEFDQEQCY